MLTGIGCRGLGLALTAFTATLCLAQQKEQKRPWKGYSILGNGHLTAVYSDDSRIVSLTGGQGIQHLYFKDYTADYVASTGFALLDGNGNAIKEGDAGARQIGMKNFFTAQTTTSLPDGPDTRVLCFVHPEDAVVLSYSAMRSGAYRFEAQLRKEIKTDTTIRLTSLETSGQVAIAVWSNGTVLAIAPKALHDKVTASGSSVSVTGAESGAEIFLVPASSRTEALSKIRALRQDKDVEATARNYWESWMNGGVLPKFSNDSPEAAAYLEAYKRNLYCVKAANLNGQIPADITGQL